MKSVGLPHGPLGGPSVLLKSVDGEAVTVSDPSHLFSADFSRDGADLVLETPGAPNIRVVDYFAHALLPDLTTPDGATLRGAVVERLAGPEAPGQYAQLGASPQGDPIGQVETLEGEARAQRVDGTVVDLEIGSKVYRNDVVITETGGEVSITFVDGTIFTLASGSRMVLDDLVYAAGSQDNSAAFNLVEGSFVFIAGQVAKTGGMEVTTPSATMGIRGTTVLVDIQTVQGVTTVAVSLNTDPDGGLGEIVINDLGGNEITTITATDTKWVVPVGDEAYEVARTADDLASDAAILADAATAYAKSIARLEAGQSLVELDSGNSRSGTGETDTDTGAGTGLDDSGDDPGDDDGDTDRQAPDDTQEPRDFAPAPTEPDTNTAPAPDDARFELPEDTRLDGTLTARDADGDPLSFAIRSGAENGVLVLLSTGEFTYTPNPDFNGQDSFTYTVSDGQGTITGATVTIGVTPVDDPPSAPDATKAGTEDSAITGVLAATDIDSPDADITYAPEDTAMPLPAGLSLAPDGSYRLDASDPAYQTLAAGETRGVTLDYTATSGGQSETGTLSITVTGVNDAPVIAPAQIEAHEDGPVVTLDLAERGSDIDNDDTGATLTYSVTGVPGAGSAMIDGNMLRFDPGAYFQDLAAGEARDVTIRLGATDSHGATDETDITVTITGVNDSAVISGTSTGAVTEDEDAATLTAAGALTVSDVDAGEAVFVAQTDTAGTYGSFTLGSDGQWTYEADTTQAAIQALGADETLTDSFTAQTADGTEQTVTVTITGVNDGAVIGGTVTGDVTEDAATLTAAGALTVSDVDAGEAVFVAQTDTAGTYGSFTLGSDGQWTYEADTTQAAIQALGADETLTDSFTAQTADGTEQTVTVTITGVNDGAVIGGTVTGDVTEDAATLTAAGALTVSDVDTGEAVFVAQTDTAGTYGSFTLGSDGQWTYEADTTQAAIQALGKDETLTDSFTAATADGTEQTVTVTITGVNDGAVIGGTATGDVTEDAAATLAASGALSVTDADTGEAEFVAQTDTAGTYGSFTLGTDGQWTYEADNSQAAIQALGKDETLTDSFTATTADGTTETVTVTITGMNDGAVIGGTATGDVTEDEDAPTLTTSGTLTVTDADAGEAVVVAQANAAGDNGFGSFTLDTDGKWTYEADTTQAAIQALGAGATLTDSFTATTADGTAQAVTVTITGENDGAVIGGTVTGDVTEDAAATLAASGALSVTDADTGEAVFVAQSGTAGTYGSFTLGTDGQWTYETDNSQAAIQALGKDERLTDSFTATTKDGTEQTVTVTITGVNDGAVISVADFAAVPEGDAGISSNTVFDPALIMTASDVDTAETPRIKAGSLSIAVAADSDTGVVTPFDIGATTATVDTANYDFLGAGESGRFVLSFDVISGEDESRHESVIEITGRNDAPVVQDILVSGNNGGPLGGTVTATDPDAGDTVSFSPGAQGPGNGAVSVNDDGSFTYTPQAGFAGFDRFEILASDGTSSDSSTVTLAVDDPGSQVARDRGLGITIDGESIDGRPAGSVNITRSTVEATPINLVFALDGSGSFADEFDDQIAAVKNALAALAEDFSGPGAPQVDVQIIVFSTDATSYGRSGVDDPTYGFTPFDLVADADAIQEELGKIEHPGGVTNWGAAINDAKAFFDQEASGGNDEVDFLYFITDGQPTGADSLWQTAVRDIRDAHDPQIFTFGIGNGFDPAKMEQTFTIDGVDYQFDSDGDAGTINSAVDLTAELLSTGLFAAELVSFSLELTSDGTDHGVIATAINEDGTGFTLPLAEIDGIEDMLGQTNDFLATAVFDLDGDSGTTSDQVTIVEAGRLSAPDAPVSPAGSDGDDLMLGGAGADTLDGGAGDDLLIGGGGDDSLLGGSGDDLVVPGAAAVTTLVDGGAGRDTLKFDSAGDLTSDVLPSLSIHEIEVLDMENGADNTLSLTVTDIEGLWPGIDTDLGILVDSAFPNPDGGTIRGEGGDTLALSNPEGTIEQNPSGTGPVTDGNGTTFDIYQFFDGSHTVLATLAVDDDVNVAMVNA